MAKVDIPMNERISISFHRGKIVTRLVLCLAFIAFILFCLIQSNNSVKPIFLFLIFVSLHILIFHGIAHLMQYRLKQPGLELKKNGIVNNTGDTSVFIPWSEIDRFEHGFYRANQQIFIKVNEPNKYNEIQRGTYLTFVHYLGKFFRTKPDLLWIDVNLLDINEKQLLVLLHSKLSESKIG